MFYVPNWWTPSDKNPVCLQMCCHRKGLIKRAHSILARPLPNYGLCVFLAQRVLPPFSIFLGGWCRWANAIVQMAQQAQKRPKFSLKGRTSRQGISPAMKLKVAKKILPKQSLDSGELPQSNAFAPFCAAMMPWVNASRTNPNAGRMSFTWLGFQTTAPRLRHQDRCGQSTALR